MQVAVLSGKGGTGKTLVSVNLSYLAKDSVYVDCDVEEPNGLLYYKLKDTAQEHVNVKIPVVNHEQCIGCKQCTEFCEFNALAYILEKVRVFKDLCHSCGGCKLVCPQNAITEFDRSIGKITSGFYNETEVFSGKMNVGIESGVPIIKELLKKVLNKKKDVFIDSPPGNGCSVMESISDADYCLLVAEPSIFGLHNLKMVYALVKVFNKNIGLVINKCNDDDIIKDFAKANKIKIVGEIPMDLELGRLNSNGEIVSKYSQYSWLFKDILNNVYKEVS